MNRDMDLITSWLRFETTKALKESIKNCKTFSETDSPFIASSNFLTIPATSVSQSLVHNGILLTHPDKSSTIEVFVLAVDGKYNELAIVQFLNSRCRLAPDVKINEQYAVGQRIDNI